MQLTISRIIILSIAFIFLLHNSVKGQAKSKQDSIENATLIKEANDLWNKGAALSKTNLDSATYYMEQSLPLYLKANKLEYYVATLNILTYNYFNQDKFESFKYYAQKAIEESERLLGKNHYTYKEALNNLAPFYRKNGEYDKAIILLNESIEHHSLLKKDQLFKATLYENLAVNFSAKKDYKKALELRQRALLLNLDSLDNDHVIIGINLKNIGIVHKELMQYDSSLIYLNKALNIFQRADTKSNNLLTRYKIMSLHALAEVWLLKKNAINANSAITKALQLQKGDKAYRKALSYEQLAKKYMLERDYQEALISIKESNRLANLNYKNNSYPKIARKLLVTSQIFKNKNLLDSAILYTQKAINILSPEFNSYDFPQNPEVEKLLAKSDAFDILMHKADYLLERYHQDQDTSYLTAAFETYSTLIELIRNMRKSNLSKFARNELAIQSLEVYENAIWTALRLFSITNKHHFKEQALEFAENNKSLLLLETIDEQFAQGNSSIPDSLLKKERDLRFELTFYQKKILIEKQKKEKANKEKLKIWQNSLFSFQEKYQVLISYLEQNHPKYHNLKFDSKTTSIDQIRTTLLTSNSALIEFFVGNKDTYIFCVTKEDLIYKSIPTKKINVSHIQQIRNFVAIPPNDGVSATEIADFRKSTHNLYEILLKSLIDQLDDSVNELYIILDDILSHLPFGILLTSLQNSKISSLPHASEYLFSAYSISYDYSATLLCKNKTKDLHSFKSDFVAFAPSFDGSIADQRDCNSDQLSQLKCNKSEVEKIDGILNGQINTNKDANTVNFKKVSSENSIIHLATHACVNSENPMLNKVYFADKAMTLLEFNNTRLNTELVVLSACNTGVGKIQKGEGVMSIAKGFMTAGSPSTMLSLWSVDDCSTSNLMGYYYKNLKSGMSKNKALQQAKIEFIENASTVQKHPFYWGAFVQFGNIKPIHFSSRSQWKLWTGLFTLLLLVGYFLFTRRKTTFS